MSEELGECPNNTENTVCLSPSCKYKHDRVWPIPPEIFESYVKEELEAAAFYAKQKLELETQHNCPCGCGGLFIPPAEYLHGPDPINQTDTVEVLTLQDLERLKKETDNAQGNEEE